MSPLTPSQEIDRQIKESVGHILAGPGASKMLPVRLEWKALPECYARIL
ncbi:MAG: hypothetical protein U0V48_05380 [Anaerolineales bacterium]